jgi:hypothetical protein
VEGVVQEQEMQEILLDMQEALVAEEVHFQPVQQPEDLELQTRDMLVEATVEMLRILLQLVVAVAQVLSDPMRQAAQFLEVAGLVLLHQ